MGSGTFSLLYTTYDLSDLGVPEGESVDRLILNSPVSGDWAGIGAIEHQILEIVVQTFIPLQGPNDDEPTVGSPFGFFGTDLRNGVDTTPGIADNDYRTRLHVIINAADSTLTSGTSDAGPTIQFEDKAGTIPIQSTEAQEGEDMVHTGSVKPFQDKTLISLRGEGSNPLVSVSHQCPNLHLCGGYFEQLGDLALTPFAIFNPSIDFDFQLTFDSESKELDLLGHSNHDGFPSYEVFARYNGGLWQTIYFWDSNEENQGPFSLFGSGEITADEPPKDLSP